MKQVKEKAWSITETLYFCSSLVFQLNNRPSIVNILSCNLVNPNRN